MCCWTCWERIVTTCNYFEDADEFDWDADVDLYIDADDKSDYPLWGRSIATTWKMLMRLIVTLIIFVGVAVYFKKNCSYMEDVDEVQFCNSCNRFSS